MTTVQLQGVRKVFGSFTAIDHLDLKVDSGRFVALLGPSGCGKTTTLRMIAGLESPTAGSILFDGADIAQKPVQTRNVGLVSQRFALFPHMTVEKNIAFGLSVRGRPKAEIRQKVEEMLEIVRLRDFRDRFPAQLSGGQMQRVAIARTLITMPSILMMDEPFSNLDTRLRGEMRRFIRELQERFAITTIFVTHDQVEAMELADMVAVVFDGRLMQFDTPDMLYKRPGSVEIARFMGVSNVYPARMSGKNRVETAFGPVCVAGRTGLCGGDEVHLMMRAETVDIFERPEEPLHQAIAGVIAARDFLGASVSYTVMCGETPVLVSEQSRRLLEIGKNVWLDIAPESVWLMPG